MSLSSMDTRWTSGLTSKCPYLCHEDWFPDTSRNLVHSADPEEIDHLEDYLSQQIPPLGDSKPDGSL